MEVGSSCTQEQNCTFISNEVKCLNVSTTQYHWRSRVLIGCSPTNRGGAKWRFSELWSDYESWWLSWASLVVIEPWPPPAVPRRLPRSSSPRPTLEIRRNYQKTRNENQLKNQRNYGKLQGNIIINQNKWYNTWWVQGRLDTSLQT